MGDAHRDIFLAGGTGYMGRRLAAELLRCGRRVRALVRPGSESRVAAGAQTVVDDALNAESYQLQIEPAGTFVHLIGVAHPSPKKGAEFQSIDLKSIQEAVKAATTAGISHFIYFSVARPAPIMQEYQAVRAEGERLVRESGIPATFVRPWYVLGPGHRWPIALVPFYAIARLIPSSRESAERLGLVTIDQMTRTLVWAVENPSTGVRAFEPPQIRQVGERDQARSLAARVR